MTCVLLVAGYATRLYPLTKDLPKSLLPVGGKTILERILQKIDALQEAGANLSRLVLVSNSRFAGQFGSFMAARSSALPYVVLDDGTNSNETRLGALADLALAVHTYALDDDLLVLAGDNLFDFSLIDFVAFFRAKGSDCICAHTLEDSAELRRTGVAELDEHQRVLSFQEKPPEPRSTWAVPPFYLYQRDTLPLLKEYLSEGGNPDAPGNFIPWLCGRKPVHAFTFSGRRYDIGTPESYDEAQRIFST